MKENPATLWFTSQIWTEGCVCVYMYIIYIYMCVYMVHVEIIPQPKLGVIWYWSISKWPLAATGRAVGILHMLGMCFRALLLFLRHSTAVLPRHTEISFSCRLPHPFRVWTPQLSPLNPQGFNSTCGGQNPISTLMVITNNWEYDIYIMYIYIYIHTYSYSYSICAVRG